MIAKTLKWEILSLLLIAIAVSARYCIGLQSPQCLSIAPGYVPDDFGVIGLMSKHTLELGEFPFFFWGQDWFGGMEAFMHGIAFWFFGVTPWAMRIAPLFLYSLFCALTFLIARDLFNEKVGFLAVLWCAFAPIKISELSVVPHTHYLETPVLGSLLIWLTIRLVLEKKESVKRMLYGLLGLFAGVSWWITPLIVFILLGIALFLLFKERKKAVFGGVVLALPAFIVGALPYLVFYARNPYSNALGMGKGFHLEYFFRGFWGLISCAVPEAFDMVRYDKFGFWAPWAVAGLYLVILLFYVWKGEGPDFLKLLCKKTDSNNPKGLLVFCLLSTVITYSLSKFAAVEGVRSRYIIGLHSLFPVFFAFTTWEVGKKMRWIALPLFCAYLLAQGSFIWAWGVHQVPGFAGRTDQILSSLRFIESLAQKTCYSDCGGEEYTFLSGERIIFCPPMRARYRPYELALDAEDHPAFFLQKRDVFKPVLKVIGGTCNQEALGAGTLYHHFQEPPWQYRQVNAKEIQGKASHESKGMSSVVLDRDMETTWNSCSTQDEGIWIELDLEKERTVGMVRFWNPGLMHRNYPRGISVETSQDGRTWREVLERTAASLYNWSGPRIYYWEWGSPWEVRFGPVQARYLRIRRFDHTQVATKNKKTRPWMIQEAYVYEVVKDGSLGSEGENELLRMIADLKLTKVYANRWISAKIRKLSLGAVKTIEEFTFLRDMKGLYLKNRLVEWNSKVGFVLEDADAGEFERMMKEDGIELERSRFGRWDLFYFGHWTSENEDLRNHHGWWWTGLGVVRTNNKLTSGYFEGLARLMEAKGRLETSVWACRKALERYDNHQKVRVKLIELLKKSALSGETAEEEKKLFDQTKPQHAGEILFKNGVEYLGYSLEKDTAKPGDILKVKYYWRLHKDPGRGMGVFVHIKGKETSFQGDHKFLLRNREVWPAFEGEIFNQEEEIRIPRDAARGEYEVMIGLFDLKSGKRHKVDETQLPYEEDRVLIGKLNVR